MVTEALVTLCMTTLMESIFQFVKIIIEKYPGYLECSGNCRTCYTRFHPFQQRVLLHNPFRLYADNY